MSAFEKWNNKDSYGFGSILGIGIALLFCLLLWGIFSLVQAVFGLQPFVKDSGIVLLGLVPNLLLLRYFLGRQKLEKTGRGILMVTVLIALVFFFLAR